MGGAGRGLGVDSTFSFEMWMTKSSSSASAPGTPQGSCCPSSSTEHGKCGPLDAVEYTMSIRPAPIGGYWRGGRGNLCPVSGTSDASRDVASVYRRSARNTAEYALMQFPVLVVQSPGHWHTSKE